MFTRVYGIHVYTTCIRLVYVPNMYNIYNYVSHASICICTYVFHFMYIIVCYISYMLSCIIYTSV